MAQDSNTIDAILERWIVLVADYRARMDKLKELLDQSKNEQRTAGRFDAGNQQEGD